MPKTILCDLGNILVTFEERKCVLERIVQKYRGDVAVVARMFGEGAGEDLYHCIDMGDITHEELWRNICSSAKIASERLTLPIFSGLYLWHLQPIKPVVDFVKTLQERYRLVAISNGDLSSRYVIDLLATHYNLRFSEEFVSAEKKAKKPQLVKVAADYLRATHSILPEECVLIDDVERYVQASIALGMVGIWHNSLEEPIDSLAQKLKQAGVV